MDFITTRRVRKTTRVRGYQITGLTKAYERIDTGLVWLASPPLQMWQSITGDATTYCATLVQSGRTLLKYEPWREQMLRAPLNRQAGFSLMR